MQLLQKLLLLKQDLIIKYYKTIEFEELNKLENNPLYKVEINKDVIKIQKKKFLLIFSGLLGEIVAKGNIHNNKITFIIEYNTFMKLFFLFAFFILIYSGFSFSLVALIFALILYLIIYMPLIVMKQDVIKLFERIWK